MTYKKVYEAVIGLVEDLDKAIKIVDLGCGRGEIITKLKELGFKNVEGWDIKKNFKDAKITNLNKDFECEDSYFDLVICTNAIGHLENKFHFLREVSRVLKPDGTFILSSPNTANIHNKLNYLFRGDFIEFNKRPTSKPDVVHFINPFFLWDLSDYFDIEEITYNRGLIPILRLPFFKNRLFGQEIIIKAHKKNTK